MYGISSAAVPKSTVSLTQRHRLRLCQSPVAAWPSWAARVSRIAGAVRCVHTYMYSLFQHGFHFL